MLIIINKNEATVNEYEVKGKIAYLNLTTKKGTLIKAKIDSDDLDRVLAIGIWFPQWHKDFNNYLVQTISDCTIDGSIVSQKQTLHSFILGTHHKILIKHKNGDTLDNRKGNLQIYNENEGINDYKESDSETFAVVLKDKFCKGNIKTYIDKKDIDKAVYSGYTWVPYKVRDSIHAVANTPKGRIYLESLLMETPEGKITQHINENTLDNRRVNLKNPSLKFEDKIETK